MRRRTRATIAAILACFWLALMASLWERLISPIYTESPQEAATIALAKCGENAEGLAWKERAQLQDRDQDTELVELIGSRELQAIYRVKLQRRWGLHGRGWSMMEYERR